jgi:hypothetical protein
MALVQETGSGLANANSYANVDDADTYFDDRGITEWTGTDAAKAAYLIRATDYIERKYGGRWVGVRVTTTQALSWPRAGGVDCNGFGILSTIVPTAVVRAVYEAALMLLQGVDLEVTPETTIATGVKREMVKAGSVATETEYFGGAESTVLIARFEAVEGLLSCLMAG